MTGIFNHKYVEIGRSLADKVSYLQLKQ